MPCGILPLSPLAGPLAGRCTSCAKPTIRSSLCAWPAQITLRARFGVLTTGHHSPRPCSTCSSKCNDTVPLGCVQPCPGMRAWQEQRQGIHHCTNRLRRHTLTHQALSATESPHGGDPRPRCSTACSATSAWHGHGLHSCTQGRPSAQLPFAAADMLFFTMRTGQVLTLSCWTATTAKTPWLAGKHVLTRLAGPGTRQSQPLWRWAQGPGARAALVPCPAGGFPP